MKTKQEWKIGNCLDLLPELNTNSIDMVLTSPPYDNLRTYDGYKFEFKPIANELFRVVKKGGAIVWIVGDQTIKGSESGTAFKQALYFKEIGFNLHDTMIYKKLNPVPNANTRYQQCFEYMFILSKGKIQTSNIQLRKRKNKCNDKRTYRRKKFTRNKNGEFHENHYHVKEYVPKDNVWTYFVGGGNSTKDKIAFTHPAIFPEQLAHDHIISWSNEGDIVLDPFVGSGTTLKMCKLLNRNGIGFESNPEYESIIKTRLNSIPSPLNSFEQKE